MVDREKDSSILIPDSFLMKPLLAILGPTAAGKTRVALEVAKRHHGEIISADSRQIYVGMDIGTDKFGHGAWGMGHGDNADVAGPGPNTHAPRPRDKPVLVEGIPHYLIDILTPDQPYSAAEFRDDARRIIADIHARDRLPIIVGGTGLYARTLTAGLPLSRVPPDPEFRAWAAAQPLTTLVAELTKRTPDKAKRMDLKNPRRVIRALEIAQGMREERREMRDETQGNLIPHRSSLISRPWHTLKLALAIDKDTLKKRIEERVGVQLKAGLVEEVRHLVERYGERAPGLQTIGYREVFPYLRGHATIEETRDAIVRATKAYARRQMTWLRKEPNLVWVASREEALVHVQAWLSDGFPRSRE